MNHRERLAFPDGSIGTTALADNSVTTAKIADLAVTTAKLDASAVTTAKIADANVTAVKILDGAVTTTKIADLNVTTGKLADDAVTIDKLDPSLLNQAEVTIATGAVLTLFGTPVQLVAAPGANKFIDLVSLQLFLDYNSAAYAIGAGDDLVAKYQNAAGQPASQTCETTGFLDQTSDQVRVVQPLGTANPTAAANQPLMLHCLNANPTTGNSPLKVRVRYAVRDLTW